MIKILCDFCEPELTNNDYGLAVDKTSQTIELVDAKSIFGNADSTAVPTTIFKVLSTFLSCVTNVTGCEQPFKICHV